MKILHVITDLGQGGAEAVLYQLIVATQGRIQHCVVSLHGDGVYGERLRKIGVDVWSLHMPRGRIEYSGLRRLRKVLLAFGPDAVQTRMYHADLIGGVVAVLSNSAPVVWAVHATDLGAIVDTWKIRAVRKICAILSEVLPSAIVTDSQKSADVHIKLGYPAKKIVVIPNGVDPAVFYHSHLQREKVRGEFGIDPETFLLGLVARWHPLKDHSNLMQALSILKAENYRYRCLLAGNKMTYDNEELARLIRDNGLVDHIILAGSRGDVPAIMNALDLHVLSSCAESLPVAVIEAMSCGTPCVVTDVGDAAMIVGSTGWVAAPKSPISLATAVKSAFEELENEDRLTRRQQCNDRIAQYFSLDNMVEKYIQVWDEACS